LDYKCFKSNGTTEFVVNDQKKIVNLTTTQIGENNFKQTAAIDIIEMFMSLLFMV